VSTRKLAANVASTTADSASTLCRGWLTDKFGVTWQTVPDGIADYIAGDHEQGSQRAMEACSK
jgi:predicted 3-demethylubiquinone-9 3-methyltransferase (glyoxalase superfamily)